jgi:hypothetical protein
VQVKLTVTLELFQPLALAGGDTAAAILGRVVSRLTVTLVVALAPAASVTVPLTTWLAPSTEKVCGLGHVTIGAVPGTQVNVTVTGVLFHPAALGVGDTAADIVGAVSSIFKVVVTDALFPATSVTVPVTF